MSIHFKTFSRHLISIGLICLLLLTVPAFVFAEEEEYWELSEAQLQWLEIHDALETHHVSNPSGEQLAGLSIEAMLDALGDPYSSYMTPEEWDAYLNSLQQKFTGIGVAVSDEEEGMRIIEVYSHSPAEQAGVRPGDYLVAIDGTEAADHSLDSFLSLIPKIEDSVVTLTLERSGEQISVEVTIGEIVVPSVDGFLFNDRVGYIQISSFASDTPKEFAEWIDELSSQGVQSLIIDIRYNPGGLLDSVKELASNFIKEGILMTVQDSSGQQTAAEIKSGSELPIPVVVLINEESASAAEVLAGFLQDYKKATLVGKRTFGKGTIQSMFPLTNGGVLKVSTEQYFTPKGNAVQEQGISPDLEVDGDLPQLLAALHALKSTIQLQIGTTVQRDERDGSAQGEQSNEYEAERNTSSISSESNASSENTETSVNSKSTASNQLAVNGREIGYEVPILQQNGRWYIHSRVLAAIVGKEVAWHGESRSVELITPDTGETIVFHVGQEAIMEQDLTYLELNVFQQQFSQVKWELAENGIQLISHPIS